LYADSEGYDTRAEGDQAELWAEQFLDLPVEAQLVWKRIGIRNLEAMEAARQRKEYH
jgi:hypothetical protein